MVRHATEALSALAVAPVPATLLRLDAQAALAYGYYLTRQNEKADAAYAALTRALEETGRDRTLAAADAWNNWALVYHRGDIRRAEGLYRRSLELHRSIAGEEGVAPVSLHNYAGVLQQLARYSEAEPVFQEAIQAARAQQIAYIELFATMELAGMLAETGRLAEAKKTLATLDPYLGTKAFTPLRRAFLAQTRGMIAWATKDPRNARERFAEAVGLYDGIPAKFSHGVLALMGLARAELATGSSRKRPRQRRGALSLSRSRSWRRARLRTSSGSRSRRIGEIELATGRAQAGRATIAKALGHLNTTLGAEHPATVAARGASGVTTAATQR